MTDENTVTLKPRDPCLYCGQSREVGADLRLLLATAEKERGEWFAIAQRRIAERDGARLEVARLREALEWIAMHVADTDDEFSEYSGDEADEMLARSPLIKRARAALDGPNAASDSSSLSTSEHKEK